MTLSEQNLAEGTPMAPRRPRKALTIGAVAKLLSKEFDDVSISKIRYLEDQKLLAPKRTPGGYRLAFGTVPCAEGDTSPGCPQPAMDL